MEPFLDEDKVGHEDPDLKVSMAHILQILMAQEGEVVAPAAFTAWLLVLLDGPNVLKTAGFFRKW